MKKILAYTLAFLSIALVSCQKEQQSVQQPEPQDGKVTFSLGFAVPEAAALTKTLGETVDLATNGLWVLVYENGYRVEAVEAENVTEIGSGTGSYTCDLTLSVSENKRNLHFLSMTGFSEGDAPYEETRLGSLTSADGLDAYWQIRTVSCIPYNVTGSATWANFLSELKGTTGTITLVRNFAKVTMSVKSGVKFQLEKFKVFKTPNKGYVAPYISSGSDNGFVAGYDALNYLGNSTVTPAVKGATDVYPGRMPSDCTLTEYSSADDNGASFYDDEESQYFYERPVPTENPAFIIVKGKYDSDGDNSYDDEVSSYYKVNLRDADDNYYALLRGFRFKVCVEKVTATGYGTVLEAYNSAGSGDISTSLDYSSINNISDGVCRLFVNETSFTAIKAGTIEVKYKFIPDYSNASGTVKNTEVDVDVESNTGVEITKNDPASGMQASIASYTVGTSDDADGWRTITVTVNDPGNLYKEQILTIRGRGKNTSTGVTTVLQRDIHIIVRPTLVLYAEMAKPTGQTYTDEVPVGAGKDVWVNIWMEDELPNSIFPINLKVEATSLTLTPASGEQLPVESGQSASTTDPKPTFYFVKAISYDDYTAATASNVAISATETRKMHKFVCKFKTNTDASASSIYVSHELFNTASTSFTNPTALFLTPVSPATWGSTASEEPYVGQTFTATVTASVPAGTTITGTTTVGGSTTNVTASISGRVLTITRTGMSYSSSGFKDLAFATTLSTGSFSYTPKVVVWKAGEMTIGTTAITNISSLNSNDYIAIYRDSYYVYDNGSTGGNSVTQSTLPSPVTSPYIWQIKDLSGSNLKLMNYGTGKYIEKRPNGNTGQTTNTTSTSSDYATLTIAYTSSSWQFKLSDQNLYFNNWSSGNANLGWYSNGAGSDSNARFQIRKCTVTPFTRPTE